MLHYDGKLIIEAKLTVIKDDTLTDKGLLKALADDRRVIKEKKHLQKL